MIVSRFWNIRKSKKLRYSTDIPKIIRQTAGCGLVNGPFGNASTDITQKKKITQTIPAQMLSSIFVSFLAWMDEKENETLDKKICALSSVHYRAIEVRNYFDTHVEYWTSRDVLLLKDSQGKEFTEHGNYAMDDELAKINNADFDAIYLMKAKYIAAKIEPNKAVMVWGL